jgi:rhodanese-related sulfurtransferase
MAAKRIDPRQAHHDLASGALLVCAYDDEEKFQQNRLEGAVSLAEFQAQEDTVPKDQEIIFYCA